MDTWHIKSENKCLKREGDNSKKLVNLCLLSDISLHNFSLHSTLVEPYYHPPEDITSINRDRGCYDRGTTALKIDSDVNIIIKYDRI